MHTFLSLFAIFCIPHNIHFITFATMLAENVLAFFYANANFLLLSPPTHSFTISCVWWVYHHVLVFTKKYFREKQITAQKHSSFNSFLLLRHAIQTYHHHKIKWVMLSYFLITRNIYYTFARVHLSFFLLNTMPSLSPFPLPFLDLTLFIIKPAKKLLALLF